LIPPPDAAGELGNDAPVGEVSGAEMPPTALNATGPDV
jgi:hypothetical protein